MYLFFDKNGILKEIVQEDKVRVGNVNSNKIYVYLENDLLITDIYYVIKKPNGELSNEISFIDNVVEKQIPYDKKRDLKYFKDYVNYKFYYIELDGDSLQYDGLAVATIRILVNDSIYAQGMITFNIENNVIKYDNKITQSQYDYLLSIFSETKETIKDKLNILDEKVYKFESHNDYNSFLNDAILKYQELGFKIFFTIINNNSVIGLLAPDTKSMLIFNSKNEILYFENFVQKPVNINIKNSEISGNSYIKDILTLKENSIFDALKGTMAVKTPSNPNDAVNKQYVDENGGLIKDYIDGKVITLNKKIDTTKSELIGTDQDAYNIDTIKGSKKYADKVKNDVTEKYDSSIKNVTQSYNDETGVITLTYTRQDNTTFNVNINTPAEKILDLNNPPRMEGNNLVLTFVDGTSVSIDMSQFVTLYFGSKSDTIDVEIDPLTNTITAKIKDGSISFKLFDDELKNWKTTIDENENVRISNENTRQTNEEERKQNETQRQQNETLRVSKENQRISAEETRVSNENERQAFWNENVLPLNETINDIKTDVSNNEQTIKNLKLKVANLNSIIHQTIVEEVEETYEKVDVIDTPKSVDVETETYPVIDNQRMKLSGVDGNTEVANLCQSLEIKGKSQVFNQYCGQETYNNNSFGTYDNINNNYVIQPKVFNTSVKLFNFNEIPLNRKVLLKVKINGTITFSEVGNSCAIGLYHEEENNNSFQGIINFGAASQTKVYNNEEFSVISSSQLKTINSIYLSRSGGNDTFDTETTIQCQVFDLTLMGIADEVNSLEDFKAKFPNEYYSYNDGSIYSVEFNKISTYNEDEEEKSIVLDNNIELNSALEVNDSLIVSGDNLGTLTKIKRVEKVDLGTLKWVQSAANLNHFYTYDLNYKKSDTTTIKINCQTPNYENATYSNLSMTQQGSIQKYCCGNTTGETFFIYDYRYNNVDDLKQSLNGEILIYEIATPVIENVSATSTILTKEEKEQVKNVNINNTNLDYVTNENNVNLGVLKNSYFGGIKTTDIDKITELSNIIFDKQELKGAELIKDKLVIYKNENDDLYTLKKITNMKNVVINDYSFVFNGQQYNNEFFYINGIKNECKYTGSYHDDLNRYFKVDGKIIVGAGCYDSPQRFITFETNKKYQTIDEVKADLNDITLTFPLATPIEEIITNTLTYEQVSFLTKLDGTIEVLNNDNVDYAKPGLTLDFNVKYFKP